LKEYWDTWSTEYEKYVNLSESLEGDLLKVEGRKEFFTTKDYRHKTSNENYYDYAFKKAGLENTGETGELFFTTAEERRASKLREELKDNFVVLWALNGSSHHKVYPMMEPVLRELFTKYPDARCITVGDEMARLMEFEHPQLIERAGKWSLRESLIATKWVDLVVGPETMITNASGCFDTPKITLLSHSTEENLTKYWKNSFVMEPSQEISPCYPCHQLHYTKESCPM